MLNVDINATKGGITEVIMKSAIFAILALGFPVFTYAGEENLPPVRTVSRVDLPRYMGRWYEISSFPQSFQKGCTNTTADYSLRDDGKVTVLNQCLVDGKVKRAKGTAYAVDDTNSKLRVSFFWPFFGDYWVLELGAGYEYAVVGAPGRDYLWVLSRTPRMNRSVYAGILARLRAQKFDVTKLQLTGRLSE